MKKYEYNQGKGLNIDVAISLILLAGRMDHKKK